MEVLSNTSVELAGWNLKRNCCRTQLRRSSRCLRYRTRIGYTNGNLYNRFYQEIGKRFLRDDKVAPDSTPAGCTAQQLFSTSWIFQKRRLGVLPSWDLRRRLRP